MPRGACIRTTMEQRLQEGWTVTDDLLALLVEVTSVVASERKLKKPIEVPRPEKPKPPRAPGETEQDAAMRRAVNVLASTTRAVNG